MDVRHSLALVIALALIQLAGCDGTQRCVEGSTQACACVGGATGVQTCTTAGTFGACECGERPDGGGLDAGTDPDGGTMTGSGETVTMTIDSSGGEIRLMNATLTIPAGAVSSPTTITVTETTMPTPVGYRAFSPLYQFEPEGLTFSSPVRVSIRSRASGADVPLGTLFWSRPTSVGGGWERVGGIPESGNVNGEVTHFSFGFIADGVDYTATPDRSCVRTRVLDVRTLPPSGVGVFFAMDDCWGRPITDLAESELEIREDDVALSSEASAALFEQRGLQVFVTLAIDVSSSTQPILSDVIAAARAFVETLNDPARGLRDRVQVAIIGFAGEAGASGFYQQHTLDLDLVLRRIDELATYSPADGSSTNLHGAVTTALSYGESAQWSFRDRNRGGAFTAGYVVLFTDGTDTSGRVTLADARAAIERSADDVLAMGLRGSDYDPAALEGLVGEYSVYDADSRVVLDRDFRHIAARVAGQVRRSYLLGYCSPKRSGLHTVYPGVRSAESRVWGTAPEFTADGFSGGCATEMFDPLLVCVETECGGFGCGACDDRLATCEPSASPSRAGACVNHCLAGNLCMGETITNPYGYTQLCPMSVESTFCGDRCTNLLDDPSNCGACSASCIITGSVCAGGICECPATQPDECDGTCIDTTTDSRHCGGCGNRCFCARSTCVAAAELTAGYDYTCARLIDSTARCWGANGHGQLGDGTGGMTRLAPVTVTGLPLVAEVAAGDRHTCARLTDATVRCWGDNENGQLGDGTTTDRQLAVAVAGLSGVVEIAAGENHTCARISDGTVRCWGGNFVGQIGDGTTTTRLVPVPVTGLSNVVQLAAGERHTCARLSDATLRCWGNNVQGQLGDGTTTYRSTPVAVASVAPISDVATGTSHTCVVLMDGTMRCWGLNSSGQLGDGTTVNRLTPVDVAGLSGAVQAAAGVSHTCVRQLDGTARCWGHNARGQLGDGTTTNRVVPSAVTGVSAVQQLTARREHTCVVVATGSVRCWGNNTTGQLGDGTTINRLSPVSVP